MNRTAAPAARVVTATAAPPTSVATTQAGRYGAAGCGGMASPGSIQAVTVSPAATSPRQSPCRHR